MSFKTVKQQPPAYGTPRGITAAAQRIKMNDRQALDSLRIRNSSSQWQKEAWAYYDAIGEVKYAFSLVASVMSRLRLYAAAVIDLDSPPIRVADAATIERPESEQDDDQDHTPPGRGIDPRLAKDAQDAMSRMFSRTSVPGLLRAYSLNVSVAGEAYVVLNDAEWQIKSTDEIQVGTDGRLSVRNSSSTIPSPLKENATVGRVWRQHPRYSGDPDSSMKALLADCEELLLLGRMIRASSRGRLNAGILYVPDEITVSRRTITEDGVVEEEEEDAFETELLFAMTSPITDETSANSVVPLLLRGPAELSDKVRHIEIGRKVDGDLVARADRTLDRIMQGIDVPKDVVTGLANVKYSNAVQIDESLYKAHVEPSALMLVDALTDICLRPILRAKGWSHEDVAKIVVWYDPAEVVTKTDRGQDADAGYAKYLLSGSAWRQARGFNDSDAPDEEELGERLALERATVPPEIATALYNKMLPSILGAARDAATADGQMPDDLKSILDGSAETPPVPVAEQSVT